MLVRLERHLAGPGAAVAGSRNAAELGLPLRAVCGLAAALMSVSLPSSRVVVLACS